MTQVEHPLYLHRNGVETEYTALWEVTTTRTPAEPYSWGGGRPDDIEASARLVSYENGTRADAVAEGGEAAVVRQEKYVAECGLED